MTHEAPDFCSPAHPHLHKSKYHYSRLAHAADTGANPLG
jgi:hypothetical protein